MAEIIQHEHKQKAGVRKTKKANLKVDLTPMVDLGFLLISFFVFTTTLAHPTAMVLKMPDDKSITDSSKVEASKTLNLILGANNNVFCYEGNDINKLQNIGSNVTNLRKKIMYKKMLLRKTFGNDSGIVVLIKPTTNATYANVLNALDEMQINLIKTYILMDATGQEESKINK